ncbi:DUF3265 domain-containing protein [Vibrio splendidus]|nr:DUF3265 domain-containing protein [Vibrio splendidus]PTP00634.1 DUF3265 domain-containing protein [Vibrio splendidus]PTP18474.1 DUF3265 domain-containing protein [Vibrio splendidus]PTP52931.1 DUF3265 domain-containing protein [Vibrio splendidus]
MCKIESQRVAFLLCVGFVFKVVCGGIGIALLSTATRKSI